MIRNPENYFTGKTKEIVCRINGFDQDKAAELVCHVLRENQLSLYHPFKPDIECACRASERIGMANVLFLSDENYENSWAAIQVVHFIDAIVVDDNCYIFNEAASDIVEKVAGKVVRKKFIPKLSKKTNQFGGFVVDQSRPFHYFYDQLVNLKKFSLHDNFSFATWKNCFFDPGLLGIAPGNKYDTKKYYYLFPTTIGGLQTFKGNIGLNRPDVAAMENALLEAAFSDKKIADLGHDLRIWIGITGQKRCWKEQVSGYCNLVLELKNHFASIQLVVDGMTATHGQRIKNPEDELIYDEIYETLNGQVELVKMIGEDYRTKILWASQCDFFIANAGTGCFVPLRVCKRPGVLHSNNTVFTFPDTYPPAVKKVRKKYIHEVEDPLRRDPGFTSYHIPWQHVFNLSAEILNEVKGKTIEQLPVPSVETLVPGLEVRKNAFGSLRRKITPDFQSADILREVALSFERIGDYETACKVMEQALLLRPNGRVLKQKLYQYRDELQPVDNDSNSNVKRIKRIFKSLR